MSKHSNDKPMSIGEHLEELRKRSFLAVVGVLLGFWLIRLPRTDPSWLDRIGLGIAAGWVVAAVAFVDFPMLFLR